MERRKVVAVLGDATIEKDSKKYKLAFELGKALIDNGYRIKTGGIQGVMSAVFEGAHSSDKYREGDTLAIIPGFNFNETNQYSDIVVPTGIDLMRNVMVANSDAVIALGGGAGTLSEIASAWTLKRLIFGFTSVDGWSKELAGRKLDKRERFKDKEDMIFPVATVDELIKGLNEKINVYVAEYIPINKKEL